MFNEYNVRCFFNQYYCNSKQIQILNWIRNVSNIEKRLFQISLQALISKTELTSDSYLPANTNMSLNVVSIYSAPTSFPENAYQLVALCTNMYPQSHTLLSTESTLGESYLLPHSHALVLVAYYPPCLWTTNTRGRSCEITSCTCLCGSKCWVLSTQLPETIIRLFTEIIVCITLKPPQLTRQVRQPINHTQYKP